MSEGTDGAEAIRLVVRGRVQGVGFRAWARRSASRLGVRGWVRNRPDGTVELGAAGSAEALGRFRELLEEGPRGARVEDVREAGRAEAIPSDGFEIRF